MSALLFFHGPLGSLLPSSICPLPSQDCLSCAASLRSLPLSPARIVFSELNDNENGEDGFCQRTLQNFVTYPLFGDVLVCVYRAGAGVYQRSQVPGRNTEWVKLTLTEVRTLEDRYTWQCGEEFRCGPVVIPARSAPGHSAGDHRSRWRGTCCCQAPSGRIFR